jgi:tetratricopeptide (TPR) repeat protein
MEPVMHLKPDKQVINRITQVLCEIFDVETKSAQDYYRRVNLIPYLKQLLIDYDRLDDKDSVFLSQKLGLMGRLGTTLQAACYFAESEALLLQAIQFAEEHLNENQALLGLLQNYLAYTLLSVNKIHEAKKYLEKALAIHLEPSIERIMTLDRLGQTYIALKDYAAAKIYLNQALAIANELLGEKHPMVARALTFLAETLIEEDNYKEAEALLEKALMIKEAAYQEDHPSFALTLKRFAKLHSRSKDHAKHQDYLHKTLLLEQQVYGNDHPYTKNTASLYQLLVGG